MAFVHICKLFMALASPIGCLHVSLLSISWLLQAQVAVYMSNCLAFHGSCKPQWLLTGVTLAAGVNHWFVLAKNFGLKDSPSNWRIEAMTAVPQSVQDTVNGIMGSEEPVLVKVKQIVDVCLQSGLAYKMTEKPVEVLTHPTNRAGQMLSAMDVWQKGMKIWSVGVRKELLCDSMAFEVFLDSGVRAQQVSANQKLVDGSNGLLAALNGQERFLNVSTSHTIA